jgi:hypothetical protein
MNTCHNYCKFKPILTGTKLLLGLGLEFYPMRPRPTNNLNKTIEKFRTDVRQITFFKNLKQKALDGSEGITYIPSLYIKSDGWKPPKANKVIEKSLNDFRKYLKSQ